uniref:Apolipoprotein L6 n=1 Tax=Castor canadensis TaxID=51338 RepID=A0A250XY61_CASCN
MDLVRAQLDNQAGKDGEAGVDLQSDMDDVPLGEGGQLQDTDLSAAERVFLKEFPRWKRDQEMAIRQLQALTDDIDTAHKSITQAKAVVNSTSVASGLMSLLGFALAPATVGGSLLLTAVGQVLGVAARVTSVVTDMLENSCKKKARAQASSLVPTGHQELKQAGGEKTSYIRAASKIVYDCGSALEIIRKHTHAFQQARAHPHLAIAAKHLLTTGQVSGRHSRQVQKAFGGTALAMTKNACMIGGAVTALFLGRDLAAVSKDWKQLKDGPRAELAEELRGHAQELAELVMESEYYYQRLRQKKLLQEKTT